MYKEVDSSSRLPIEYRTLSIHLDEGWTHTLLKPGRSVKSWAWDAETGKLVGETFRGHRDSVAFSPDSSRLVSGSGDTIVRMLDAGSGKQVGEPFEGPTDRAMSVALGEIIRIWDAETGKPVGNSFEGPTDRVISVALGDETVQIWDAETERLVGRLGHTDWVRLVAFSTDGRCVVSGSNDVTDS